MTKEIDIFSVSKNTESKTASSPTNTTKKEGMSLFDSILTTSKKEISENKKDIKEKSTQDEIKANSKVKIEEKNTDKISTEDKTQTKSTSSNSLLDRMILEAKKDIKTINEKDIKKASEENKTTTTTKEEKKENLGQEIKKVVEENKTVDKKDIKKASEENKTTTTTKEEKKENLGEDIKKVVEENKTVDKKDIEKVSEENKTTTTTKEEKKENLGEEIKKAKVETSSTTVTDNISTSLQKDIDNKEKSKTISEVKNPKVAQELSNIVNNEEELLVEKEPKNNQDKSLMDKLIDKANNNTIPLRTLNQEVIKENNPNNLLTNIYLSSQKNLVHTQTVAKKSEAVKVLKEGNTVSSIKDASKILELNAQEISLEVKKHEDRKLDNKKIEKETTLDRFNFIKQSQRENLEKIQTQNLSDTSNAKELYHSKSTVMATAASSTTNSSSTTSTNSNSVDNTPVSTVTVSNNLAQSIQNRIVGARQQMSAMMSDMARTMYENYKPPVTAFRINLMPAQLGSIAILMKSSERDSSLSISMNLSNSKTLDSFIDNQSSLKDALSRTFEGQTSFNLEFNMEENSSGQSDFDQEETSAQNRTLHSSSQILESRENNKNVGEDLNYL